MVDIYRKRIYLLGKWGSEGSAETAMLPPSGEATLAFSSTAASYVKDGWYVTYASERSDYERQQRHRVSKLQAERLVSLLLHAEEVNRVTEGKNLGNNSAITTCQYSFRRTLRISSHPAVACTHFYAEPRSPKRIRNRRYSTST